LFQDGVRRSDLVYLELENIVCRLLEKDLFDPSTISHQLLFDPELRGRLIENLDGQRGCWHHEKLSMRCSDSSDVKGQNTTDSTQGTIFFWGVDEKGRKIPLGLVEGSKTTSAELRGIDDSEKLFTCPFTPADINRGLQDGRLLPSIFTSYLLVSIARGISCIGGYYQAEYLPIMRTAVIDTLRSNSGKTIKTFDSGKLRLDPYLSGMQTIGLKTGSQLFPAGPLEIIASGGLSAEQLQQVGGVTVLQSHIASLYDTMTDVAPQRGDYNLQKKEISRLVHDAVGSKILTISLG
jgi:hypothetical protein